MKEFIFVDSVGDYTDSIVEGSYIERDCDAGAAVGNLVYDSLTLDDYVDIANDNVDSRSVIGIIVEIPEVGRAIICTKGQISGLSGLTKAGKVFLSDTGGLSTILPDEGYLQILGRASDSGVLNFNPINTKILRTEVQVQMTTESGEVLTTETGEILVFE